MCEKAIFVHLSIICYFSAVLNCLLYHEVVPFRKYGHISHTYVVHTPWQRSKQTLHVYHTYISQTTNCTCVLNIHFPYNKLYMCTLHTFPKQQTVHVYLTYISQTTNCTCVPYIHFPIQCSPQPPKLTKTKLMNRMYSETSIIRHSMGLKLDVK